MTTTADPSLRHLCGGAVHQPGDPGYDAARTPWNLAVDQRPAAVAYPGDATETAAVIRAAARSGLRIAPQGTGHNAGALGALDDVLLLRTSAMTGVQVDVAARRARVEAGALWMDVMAEVVPHGLTALHGSSPDVGVAGYSLGGGMGWFARELGLQTNRLTAIELVTADGTLVRADAVHETELFWALRGGGGNFGVVTALEFELFPLTTAYAGLLAWDQSAAEPVLRRWRDWAATAPDAVTTSLRLLNFPPIPDVPEVVRGRRLVAIDGAVLAGDETAERILAPLRELRPEIDTFARVPTGSLIHLHMDPPTPTPVFSTTAVLGGLPDAGVDALLAAAGPDSGTTLMVAAEVRQLGGAVGRSHPGGGALDRVDGEFLLFACGVPVTPELAVQGHADCDRLDAAVRPWANGSAYLNFVERPSDASAAYSADTWARLRRVRAAADPDGLFVSNHVIPAQ
jgi:FAD/FMN-containing dehydrogenase